jgi:hypothetical protein
MPSSAKTGPKLFGILRFFSRQVCSDWFGSIDFYWDSLFRLPKKSELSLTTAPKRLADFPITTSRRPRTFASGLYLLPRIMPSHYS